MKKLIALLLALTLSAALTVSFADQLSEAQARGSLIFATEGNWAPWTYYGDDGARAGFDIEVAEAVAAKLGLKAEFIDVEWSGIFAGIDVGRYTTAANGVDVTEDRAAKYDFTTPYCYNRVALVVRSDNESITSFADLNGKVTTNSPGSTYAQIGESFGARVMEVEALAETMNMVINGRADATINAIDSFNDYMSQQPDAPLKIAAMSEDSTPVAFPIRKGDSETLVAAINKAIEELRADGTLAEISMKYFGYDITAE